mmetsp:Transcript_1234/g.2557  ORF Transcript_1234/g.2557 Transcript_1234/m.2557 type:complete len:89 (+) Transcript_1234:291-557(+)
MMMRRDEATLPPQTTTTITIATLRSTGGWSLVSHHGKKIGMKKMSVRLMSYKEQKQSKALSYFFSIERREQTTVEVLLRSSTYTLLPS